MPTLALVPIPRLQICHRLVDRPQRPTAVQFPAPELLSGGCLVWNHLNRVIRARVVGDLLVFPHDLLFGLAEEEGRAVGERGGAHARRLLRERVARVVGAGCD